MLSYIDETRMSREFNLKERSFTGGKTDDMFHYLVPLLEKNPDYVILHVGTNDAVDHQSSDIISKILKKFIQSRKFYVRRNNNKADSVETRRIVIAPFAPLNSFRKLHVHHAFLINDNKFYRHYLIYKYNFTLSLFCTTYKLTNDKKII